MQIIKKSDNRQNLAIVNKIADIPNGVTVSVADMTQSVIYEGTPVGRDGNGLCHIIKMADVAVAGSATTDTTYTVKKGHNFAVGTVIMSKVGGKASAITAIATNAANSAYDDITVGASLGVTVAVGDVLMEAASATTSNASKFLYTPFAIVGESYNVVNGDSMIVNAWLHAVVKEACLNFGVSADVKSALTTISFI